MSSTRRVKWPHGYEGAGFGPAARPCLPVVMRTAVDRRVVKYAVVVHVDVAGSLPDENYLERVVWAHRVLLSRAAGYRAGGPACQSAAQIQQRLADEWVEAIRRHGEKGARL